MAGFKDTDIRLDDSLQISKAASGDIALISDFECLRQDISLEALTQERELFYDHDYGWSLLDFVQAEDDEMTRMEIEQRIISKLSKRQEVNLETIKINIENQESGLLVGLKFSCLDDKELELNLSIDRVNVEVVIK